MRYITPGRILVADKHFFGPGGTQNTQIFGAAGGTWTKPTPPVGRRIVSIQFIAVGAGGGGSSGAMSQASGSGIGAVATTGGGGAGGWCSYFPNPALVPASVVITAGTGGPGGAAQTLVGSFPLNGNGGLPGTAGSANTNVGGGVIVCTPGGANFAGNAPAGTGSCTGAWGGAFTTATGGRGSTPSQPGVNQATYPTNAQRQVYSTSAAIPGGAAGQSVANAPGGGGGMMEWNTSGAVIFEASCFGGAPGVGSVGGSPGVDFNLTQTGPSFSNITASNAPAAGALQGGGGGSMIFLNPTSSPAANNWTMVTGIGGNGGAGGGGGVGGFFTVYNFPNPAGASVTASAGGKGGDGQVTVIVIFG